MKNKIIIGFGLIFFVIVFRFYFGIYVHEEFGDKNLFLKHRPVWKWKFYSPIRMSDLKIKDLTIEKQIEEKYYDEFIRKNN
jgi:hypothetical protein